MTRLFSYLPGGVRKVWLNRDLKDMPDLYNRRLAACNKLESAETALLGTATKRRNKKLKKEKKLGDENKSTTALTTQTSDPEALKSLSDELVPTKKRPTHRLPIFSWMPFSLPLIGKQVDSIDWAREEIRKTSDELAARREILKADITRMTAAEEQVTGRKNNGDKLPPISVPFVGTSSAADFSEQTYPPANGAFVLFNNQTAAHLAAQSLTHHEPYCMSAAGKYVEVTPQDVIWDNLSMNPYERRVRLAIGWAFTVGLIILWAIPGTVFIRLVVRHSDITMLGSY